MRKKKSCNIDNPQGKDNPNHNEMSQLTLHLHGLKGQEIAGADGAHGVGGKEPSHTAGGLVKEYSHCAGQCGSCLETKSETTR